MEPVLRLQRHQRYPQKRRKNKKLNARVSKRGRKTKVLRKLSAKRKPRRQLSQLARVSEAFPVRILRLHILLKTRQISHRLISFYLDAAVAVAAATSAGTIPAKPGVQLNRAVLGALGLKNTTSRPDASKNKTTAAASMDDFAESSRKLVKLDDMPAIDLTVSTGTTTIGDNLEGGDEEEDDLGDGVAPVVAEQDVVMKASEEMDEDDEIDPLDAFMTDVTQEVKKVNDQDRAKLKGTSRQPIDGVQEGEDEDDEEPVANDDVDTANMRPEDILAYVPLSQRFRSYI